MATTGRPSKGDRTLHTLRVPTDHWYRYAAEADRLGLSHNDYLGLALARLHGLPVPEYITRKLPSEQDVALGA